MRIKRLSLLVGVVLVLSGSQFSAAADGTKQQLVRLENKFFGHTFDTETTEDRCARLEKMVFGDIFEGNTPDERVQNLTAAAFGSDAPAAEPPAGGTESTSTPAAQTPATQSSQPPDSDDGSQGEQYPHINELEKDLLGQSYPGQALTARLARMETKAFGGASTNPDLSARTDALDQYVQTKLGKKFPVAPPDDDVTSNDSDSVSQQSNYPRVTALENTILGQTHADQPLVERLNRLETTAFGKPVGSDDLGDRTDALEKYADKKFHKKWHEQEIQEQPQTADAGTSRGPHVGLNKKQMLAMVGNTLLNMAGMGPFGLAGVGPGAFGMNGSGAQSSAQSTDQKDQTPAHVDGTNEDPCVYAAEPPGPDAKLISKVGWCEMQVFHLTFSSMHLPERLVQLSRQLHFEEGKSGVDLMDRVPAMVKVVQARQQHKPTVEAATGSGTH